MNVIRAACIGCIVVALGSCGGPPGSTLVPGSGALQPQSVKGGSASPAPRYSAVSIPTAFVPWGTIMKNGTVPGAGRNQAALYRDGRIVYLGSLGNLFNVTATSVNVYGQAVGFGETPDFNYIPLSFQKGSVGAFAPPGGEDFAKAISINDRGDVVGECNPVGSLFLTFLDLCQLVFAGSIGGIDYGLAGEMANINNHAEFVGTQEPSTGTSLAELGIGRSIKDIFATRIVDGFPVSNSARWVNEWGDIVGASTQVTAPNNSYPYVILNGHLELIGALPGHVNGVANGINNRHNVVGNFEGTPFLWIRGTTYDLNALISGAKLGLTDALGIDDRGDILARTPSRTYLLKPF